MFLHKLTIKSSATLVIAAALAFTQAAPAAHAFGKSPSGSAPASGAPAPKPAPIPSPTALPPTSGLPASSTHVSVSIRSLSSGFDAARTTKVEAAARLMEKVINSEEFRQAVLGFSWNGQVQFADNNGLTNDQILQTIRNGSETLDPADDHTADLHLELYTPNFWSVHKVVGYTDPSTLTIFMNYYFFDSFDLAEVAGNLSHEWMHKLGFDHDFNATAKRPYSVPYGVGDLVVTLGEKILGAGGAGN